MAKRDCYEILGVERNADATTIKKAFRQLALQYHPDRNPNNKDAEAKFREATEAYEILSDPQKRAAYDQMGYRAFDGGIGGGPGGFGAGMGGGFSGRGFTDIFEEMFREFSGNPGASQSQGAPYSARGDDLKYDLTLTLEEAFAGAKPEIKIQTLANCTPCKGQGKTEKSTTQTCAGCRGTGRQRLQQGFFMVERTCGQCQGNGVLIKDPCTQCHGQGRVPETRKKVLNVPAGVEEGTRLRLSGEGEAGIRGGAAGDLYIFISIKPHAFFERDGMDLYSSVPIPMTTAALGGKIDVPTIEGDKATIAVPEGTQSGQMLRLKGKGMTGLRTPLRGDMHIEISVETPMNLTRKQKELLQEFDAQTKTKVVNPQSEGFLKKMASFWGERTPEDDSKKTNKKSKR